MKVLLSIILILNVSFSLKAQKSLVKYRYTIKLNELCAWNESGIRDEKGQNEDWLEIYNFGLKPINLANLYFTDDKKNLTKWRVSSSDKRKTEISSKSFKILWMDGKPGKGVLHANFKLSKKGEFLAVVAPDGKTIIDSLVYKKQYVNISYGRSPSAPSKFMYFDKQSPKTINNIGKRGVSQKPKVIKKSGFYPKKIYVDIIAKDSSKIYYTLDGKEPVINSALKYEGPILIDSTAVLKARVIEKNKVWSEVVNCSFFIKEKSGLPVISISIDPNKLYNISDGIFYMKNYLKKHEKIAFFEYFEGKKRVYKSSVKVKVHGAFSGSFPQKSLVIQSAGSNGSKTLNYSFFHRKPHIKKVQSVVLRNAGNDWLYARMRDVVCHDLIDTSYVNVNNQAFELVTIYINGEYWGLYNMREKMGLSYLEENHGVMVKDIEMLEKAKMVVKGSRTNYESLVQFVEVNDLNDPSNYDKVRKMMDIDNFIDYQVVQIVGGNKDWPQNNVKYWRDLKNNGPWKWLIYDLDESFKYPSLNSLELALGRDSSRIKEFGEEYSSSTVLLRRLMENVSFKRKFLTRLSEHLNLTFSPYRVTQVCDKISKKMEPEIVRHYSRWYPHFFKTNKIKSNNDKVNIISRDYLEYWKRNVSKIKQFAVNRRDDIDGFVLESGLSKGVYNIEIKDLDSERGIVKIANTYLDKNKYEGRFYKGCPITVTAIPNDGYYLKSWSGSKKSKNNTIIVDRDVQLTPVFEHLP